MSFLYVCSKLIKKPPKGYIAKLDKPVHPVSSEKIDLCDTYTTLEIFKQSAPDEFVSVCVCQCGESIGMTSVYFDLAVTT